MLTTHQNEVLTAGLKILDKEDRLLLKGSAGTGKTYLMNEFVKKLEDETVGYTPQIVCSAPTNKAVRVLMGKIDESDNISFKTTHSALKLKRKINFRTGAITFKPDYRGDDTPLQGVDFFIIDETSMLNKELLKYLEEAAKEHSVTVIFIGDNKQLPPVGEKVSPVFVAGYPEVELTEIIRQGEGSSIITLSRNITGIGITADELDDKGDGYLYSNDTGKVVATLAAVNGTDEVKYLAWTNKEVDRINNLVRKSIYGNPKKIEIGETLVFNTPYGEKYFTNQEVKVEAIEFGHMAINHAFTPEGFAAVSNEVIKLKVYRINPKEFSLGMHLPSGLLVVHEDSQADYDRIVKDFKAQCGARTLFWRDYYAFIEQFADLKYNHALTIHKSQGSTYKKTIINVANVCQNKDLEERHKMLYTAVTRSSNLLILYNAKK